LRARKAGARLTWCEEQKHACAVPACASDLEANSPVVVVPPTIVVATTPPVMMPVSAVMAPSVTSAMDLDYGIVRHAERVGRCDGHCRCRQGRRQRQSAGGKSDTQKPLHESVSSLNSGYREEESSGGSQSSLLGHDVFQKKLPGSRPVPAWRIPDEATLRRRGQNRSTRISARGAPMDR
jgi:hypothetical protein